MGATYQQLVNKMFIKLIGHMMKIYVDDMPVKTMRDDDQLTYLDYTQSRMNLNLDKCEFIVSTGKFLGPQRRPGCRSYNGL